MLSLINNKLFIWNNKTNNIIFNNYFSTNNNIIINTTLNFILRYDLIGNLFILHRYILTINTIKHVVFVITNLEGNIIFLYVNSQINIKYFINIILTYKEFISNLSDILLYIPLTTKDLPKWTAFTSNDSLNLLSSLLSNNIIHWHDKITDIILMKNRKSIQLLLTTIFSTKNVNINNINTLISNYNIHNGSSSGQGKLININNNNIPPLS